MIEEDGYTLEHARRERHRMAIFIAMCLVILLLAVGAVILINSRRPTKPSYSTLQPNIIEQSNTSTSPVTREHVSVPPPPAVKAVQPDGSRATSILPGSIQGKAILAIMREQIEDEADQKVIFQNVSIRVQGAWALFKAGMRDEKGGKVSTYPSEDGSPDHPSSRVVALLRVTRLGWSVQAIDSSATKDSTAALRRVMPNAPPGLFAPSEQK